MNPAHEIAPFFPSTTEPGLLRFAADTLRQLRTFSVRNEISVEARSALPAISALLACERYVGFAFSRPFSLSFELTCVWDAKVWPRYRLPGSRSKEFGVFATDLCSGTHEMPTTPSLIVSLNESTEGYRFALWTCKHGCILFPCAT